jgi:phospholipid/cholesterol/gamma-HCH transport system substrate-binding protein
MNRTSKAFRTAVMVEHQVFGVAFLALLVLFGWLTYAIFSKKFTDYVPVTLESSKAGLQLPANADVKMRGVIVGEVRGREVTEDGVRLSLGLFPGRIAGIPADVTARIIPKTLFGEKYVALDAPRAETGEHIASGAVIGQSEVAIEVEQVLNDLYPLLRAVQPAEINYTLTAMATALEGRGEDLGANLATLNDYLGRMNPRIPALVEDLRMLSDVSDTYRSVMPELARLLRNSVVTGNTFVGREQKVQALFEDVAGLSSTTRDFLQQNGDNIIRLSRLGQQQLPVFAKYAPEYPCLLQAQVNWLPRMNSGWRGHELHINLETLPKQPRGYTPADDPRYADTRGPSCLSLPADPYSQAHLPPPSVVPDIDDGVDSSTGKMRPAPDAETAPDLSSGYAGTAAERELVDAIAARVLGVPVDDVPDIGSLLLGPLARGTEVSLR